MLLSFIRVAWENANILFQILFHTSNFSKKWNIKLYSVNISSIINYHQDTAYYVISECCNLTKDACVYALLLVFKPNSAMCYT